MKTFLFPKALSHITTLPRHEVLELIDQIETASTRKKLLSSLKKLANMPATSGNTREFGRGAKNEVEQFDPNEGVEAIRREVFRILSDNDLFETKADLARAIELELGISMDSGNGFRESRQKIIQNAWEALVGLKNPTFRARVAKFLEKFGPSQDDYYKRLFNILSRRE